MNNKRLTINLISSFAQFTSNLIIGLFFTPYIVVTIGKEAYGFFALASNMASYLIILTIALNSMASRYITIEWHKGNKEKANQYFNTVFFSNLGMTIFMIIIIFFVVLNLENLLNIPIHLISSVKWLFTLVFISTLLAVVGSVFNTSTFCADRLDLRSGVAILNSILRIVILLFLFTTMKPEILFLGISTLITTLIEIILNFKFTKELLPNIKLDIKSFRRKYVKELVNSGIWNSFNQLNTILINGLDVLIANIYLNPSFAGLIALSKNIPNMIFTLSLFLSNVFLPQFTIAYSQNNQILLKKQLKLSFNIIGFVSSIILAGFIVFGRDFYNLWLPNEDTYTIYILSLLSMISFFTILGTKTMGSIELLTNKLKLPVIITLARSILGLLIVFLFLSQTNYGLYAISGVSSILELIYDLTFSVPYISSCIGYEKRFFYYQKTKTLLTTFLLVVVFSILKKIIFISSWEFFLIVTLLCVFIGCLINSYIYFGRINILNVLKFSS